MRIAPRHGRVRRRIALPMSSMIDVVFLLLAYFVVTSMVMEREDRLSPTLQVDDGGEAGVPTDFEPQIVEVRQGDAGPVWWLGSRRFTDRAALTEALRRLPKAPGLFVRVSAGPDVAAAAAAIQCGRDAGFEEVTYVPAED